MERRKKKEGFEIRDLQILEKDQIDSLAFASEESKMPFHVLAIFKKNGVKKWIYQYSGAHESV